MFLRILKKDLKRKKTMNIILLVFVLMCSMFAAASVNNIFAVTGGIESFFEKSGVPELMLSVPYDSDLDKEIEAMSSVRGIKAEHHLTVLDSGCFSLRGKKFDNFTNFCRLMNSAESAVTYFDEDNNELGAPGKGEFYATSVFINDTDIKKGDEVTLSYGGITLTLKYMGRFKTAVYGHSSTDYPYIMLSEEDFARCAEGDTFKPWSRKFLFIETDDAEGIINKYENLRDVSGSVREEIKDNYLYDMISAYLMMVISIVLMITGFVMLRFTIGFTISEEFREIGVMKAIGIDNGSIRRLYIVKYLGIAVIGTVAGFLCSIPMNRVMLESISYNMVFDASGSLTMGLVTSAAIIVLIMLFCYFCTRRIKKLSPIDAVRSGQTGERFGKKSIMHLGRSKLPATGFLAVNDVLSAPRQFAVMTVIFALCILMMTSISCFGETLKSTGILGLFGVPDSDISIGDVSSLEDTFSGRGMQITVDRFDGLLAANGIPGKSMVTVGTRCDTANGDKKSDIYYMITKGVGDEEFPVDEGTKALKPDEVVFTRKAMDEIGAKIGDRVKISIGGSEKEFIITGSFSSFQGGGSAGRLSNYYEPDADKISGSFGIQIRLNGSRDEKTVDEYVEKLKKVLDSEKVYPNGEMIEMVTGLSSTMNSMKRLMMLLTVIVTALIAVLTERSFISKEKSEIALMKALGIKTVSIVGQHVLRFALAAVLAGLIASAAVIPLSSALLGWVFSMIGDVKTVSADFNAAEIFAGCPALLIGTVVIFSAVTALYMKKIKASDTASIE